MRSLRGARYTALWYAIILAPALVTWGLGIAAICALPERFAGVLGLIVFALGGFVGERWAKLLDRSGFTKSAENVLELHRR